jgi:hypothetical protein
MRPTLKCFTLVQGTETMVTIVPIVVSTSPAAEARFKPVDRDCYARRFFISYLLKMGI